MGRYTRRSWTDWGRWWGVRLPFLCALWMTSFAQNSRRGPVNIATGMRDSAYQQSSKHPSQRHASNGANGNTDGRYSADNCVHTYDYFYSQSQSRYIKDKTPWWEVNLDRPTYVYNIKIWGRTGQIPRLYPFTIRVDNKLCVYVTQSPGTREITVNCTTPLYGQVVRLTRSTKQEDVTLNMCEFQILVCQAGYYGMDCSRPCSNYCTSDGCYMNNGTCITCKPGWYGDQCLTRCPSHCLECDQRSGVCLDCEGNFAGDSCTDCNSGMYGESCQHTCSSKTAKCERCDRDGRCTSCVNNFKPPNCTECVEGYYRKSISKCWRCSSNCASRSCNPETGKCNECPDGRHGNQCNLTCPQSCVRCEQDSGQCTECDFNRQPPDCVECLDGYYKQYKSSRWCTQCIGTCLKGTVCDKTSGHCPACPPGKRGTLCWQDCERRTYGQNCSQQCGRCKQPWACDVKNGSCHECQTGWQMPLCQEKCEDSTYGDGCRQACGHCKDNSPCNNVNGVCQQCQPGWSPPLCARPCQDGLYGMNCAQRCGNCLHDVVCNKTNGHCPCPLGKQPPLCDTNCQNNTYGQDCREKCGQCLEGSACEPTNGHCAKGCQPGWIDPTGLTFHLCKSACPAGLYGDQCNQTCGYCHSSSPCHHVTGKCQQGCAKGFTGVYCMEDVSESEDSSSTVGVVTPVITIVLLLLIAGAGAAFLYRRKRLSRRENAERSNDPRQGNERNQGVAEREAHIYQNIHLDTAERGVHFIPDAADGDTTARPMVPITPGASQAKTAAGPSSAGDAKDNRDKSLEEEEEESWEEEFSHEDLYASYSTVSGRCQLLDAFHRQLLDSLAALERLSQQFQSFPRGMRFEWKAGSSPENLAKNRFKQLGAYDKNRVKLVRTKGDNTTDYINASYIKGAFRDREYIATQGPMQQTQTDLWLMVWQENISQIVMLTNLEENGKAKCCKYWPDVGQTVRVRQLEVKAIGEDFRADFVIRSFSLSLRGSSGTRSVRQYHYVSWPDHGVPTAVSLLDYWLYVTAHASLTVPPVVHCSAGVGRTGTYIALDIAINRKSRGLEVNVLDIVKELREQRALMVQTEAQYKFLHEIVLEAYSSQNTRLSYHHLELNFSGDVLVWKSQSVISREYQMLQQMKSWAKRNTAVAELPENVKKNRDPSNLPDDRYLAYLTEYAKGRNQYINAVFKSSLTNKQGLVLTQLPLADTVVDLWRLVEGSQVQTIVSLGPLDEDKTVQDLAPYWPVKKGKTLRAGHYTVSLGDTTWLADCITAYTLVVKSKGKSRSVQLIHYADWLGDEPGNISDVCHLVTILRSTATSGTSPLVIQCLDGTSKSGLFCVLYDVICRMRFDEAIDVFSAVRSVHQIRPNAVTEAQYHYCYKVAQQFKQSQVEYGNV